MLIRHSLTLFVPCWLFKAHQHIMPPWALFIPHTISTNVLETNVMLQLITTGLLLIGSWQQALLITCLQEIRFLRGTGVIFKRVSITTRGLCFHCAILLLFYDMDMRHVCGSSVIALLFLYRFPYLLFVRIQHIFCHGHL